MTDTEICRLCAEALGLVPYRYYGNVVQHASDYSIYVVDKNDGRGYSEYSPLTDTEQAAAVRWKLLEIGYAIHMYRNRIHISGSKDSVIRTGVRRLSDEYRLLAETLARHQRETKNG